MPERQWKPGDVALVEVGCWANPRVAVRTGVPSNMGWAYCGEHDGRSTQNWTADSHGTVTPIRPLVVIDPENREQVERLTDALQGVGIDTTGWDLVRAALREFADPKPPKPEEPTGLGAVVEDAAGLRWTRVEAGEAKTWNPWFPAGDPDMQPDEWARIDAVRVLSPGYTPEPTEGGA